MITSKGLLIGWGLGDVENLLKNANRANKSNLHLDQSITVQEAECIFARDWFEAFVEKGLSKEIINKLNSRISHVRYHHVLMYSAKGLPYWRRVANADQIDEPELSIAYAMAHLAACGAFVGLKRCVFSECQDFFVGRPNKKWCSDSCGSHFRVNKSRKKNNKDVI